MKSTIKFFLVVVLFCSTAFAEGNMGSGGLGDDGNMGSGGKTCQINCSNDDQEDNEDDSDESDNLILDLVQDYLFSIFG